MTPQELAQFIQYIKSANTGQISVLLRILGQPLAEPMDSALAEVICRDSMEKESLKSKKK